MGGGWNDSGCQWTPPPGAGPTTSAATDENVLTAPVGYLRDVCAGGDPVPIKVIGTQLVIPRKANKAFGKGAKLTAPQAQAFLYSGNESAGTTYPVADTTLVGNDFAFKK